MATSRKATGRRTTRKTQRKGGSLRMGEGKNFGKGQTRRTGARGTRSGARRVRGERVTREPQVLGMRGGQGRPEPGGEPIPRPDEGPVGDFGMSDELEQGF